MVYTLCTARVHARDFAAVGERIDAAVGEGKEWGSTYYYIRDYSFSSSLNFFLVETNAARARVSRDASTYGARSRRSSACARSYVRPSRYVEKFLDGRNSRHVASWSVIARAHVDDMWHANAIITRGDEGATNVLLISTRDFQQGKIFTVARNNFFKRYI